MSPRDRAASPPTPTQAAAGAVPPQNLEAESSVLGGIQTGIAVAGAVELVRIGVDVFSDKPAKPAAKGPTATVSVNPVRGGGGMIGVAGSAPVAISRRGEGVGATRPTTPDSASTV